MSNLERFKMSDDQEEMAQLISECSEDTEIIVVNGCNRLTGNYESLICSYDEDDDGGCSILPLGVAFGNDVDVFAQYELPFDSLDENELIDYAYGSVSTAKDENKKSWWKFW